MSKPSLTSHRAGAGRWLLAMAFAAASSLFALIWIVYARSAPAAELGVEFHFAPHKKAMFVERVRPGTAAERAGILPGDAIAAINGRRLDSPDPYFDLITRGEPGDGVTLAIWRSVAQDPAAPAQEIAVPVTLLPNVSPPHATAWARIAAEELIHFYPVLFLIVGCGVLFLRLDDRNAWLLALLFGAFIAAVPMFHVQGAIHPALRPFALAYKVAFSALVPALFYFFFAVFPAPSPLERKAPWLKWVLLGLAGAVALPFALWVMVARSTQPLLLFFEKIGIGWRYTELGAILTPALGTRMAPAVALFSLCIFVLGLISLLLNLLRAPTPEARRKTRVIFLGTLVGLAPLLLLGLAAISQRRPYYSYPFWIWVPTIVASFLLPISFAYAVVRHKVLEIPALLRQSVRYLLVQQGFVLAVFAACVVFTIAIGAFFRHAFLVEATGSSPMQLGQEAALPVGMAVGVGVGIILTWAGSSAERRISQRVDRAFFRGAYDQRLILEDLAEKIRGVTSRRELAELLEEKITAALHPKSFAVYFRGQSELLAIHGGHAPAGLESLSPETISERSWEVLRKLAATRKPWDVPPMDAGGAAALNPGGDATRPFGGLAMLEPDCLVPISGVFRAETTGQAGLEGVHLLGLLSLGQRLSDEPYSNEDLKLLEGVATQAGLALESIGLAEDIARRMERERKATTEIQIAKEVQSKLFPQTSPPLQTLDYVGRCIQARTVGGDYYDFLAVGEGRVALVLADVAGKGISAALLMAHLQASLRSQAGLVQLDPQRLLTEVNRLFLQATFSERFATVFMGVYEDASRTLRWVNCGHNPPYLLRGDGTVEKLDSTALVLGLVEPWECELREAKIEPGDTLVIYSDGVTDATSDDGVMFEDHRLRETLIQTVEQPIQEMLESVIRIVQTFSGTEAEDDITLLIARGR